MKKQINQPDEVPVKKYERFDYKAYLMEQTKARHIANWDKVILAERAKQA